MGVLNVGYKIKKHLNNDVAPMKKNSRYVNSSASTGIVSKVRNIRYLYEKP